MVDHPIDQLLKTVQDLDRSGCKTQLRGLDRIHLDFTDEYLDALTLERLRHILVAACIQSRKTRK